MVKWINKFRLKIWDKIEDHLAGYIAVLIMAIFSAGLLFLREWLFTTHTLELYGGLWLLLLFLFLILLGYFVCSILRKKVPLTDPESIKNVLHKYLWHCTHNVSMQEFTFTYTGIDEQQNLKRGSAKKYLREVIMDSQGWCVLNEGEYNIRVRYKRFIWL